MFRVVEENIANLILTEIYGVAKLFHDLEDDRYLTIVKMYISEKKAVEGAFDVSDIARYYEKIPEDIWQLIDDASQSQKPKMGRDDIFAALVDRAFDREVTQRLAALPMEEYLRVFKENEGERLSNIIHAIRQYLTVANPSEDLSEIMDRAGNALREVAKESKVNELRAMRYGLIQRLLDIERQQRLISTRGE
ncbi:hypothetical protein ATY77_05275 [Rhizobium sp. R634]|uniref:hypothetical protein n=1 Tax=Rhizobium sp. R634 TaxID=1764274 RepID=UPI000B537F8B|nr:hypothetical protein [Rhizobium sp. R634]OWV75983.1 hypothetical protein ATY77_05275 [Rhizobium sp. R634]